MISVVIPAYNEATGIDDVLTDVVSLAESTPEITEVVIVDDGSTDDTVNRVRNHDVRLVEHEENRGYGASLKTGIRRADSEWILIMDADGTYPLDRVPDMIDHVDEYDMVVGARTGETVSIPTYRRPAKWFLNALANYLAESKIPDINSGLRLFRKRDAEEFFHILPSGFSFTTTITLAFETTNRFVRYVPIDYHDRSGSSKINPFRDGMNFIALIFRTITYFNPLKIFLPFGVGFILLSICVFAYTSIFLGRFMDVTTIVLAIAGVQTVLYALLADLVVKRA